LIIIQFFLELLSPMAGLEKKKCFFIIKIRLYQIKKQFSFLEFDYWIEEHLKILYLILRKLLKVTIWTLRLVQLLWNSAFISSMTTLKLMSGRIYNFGFTRLRLLPIFRKVYPMIMRFCFINAIIFTWKDGWR
jgi:hypothetical protein